MGDIDLAFAQHAADSSLCFVPQVESARRFGVGPGDWPFIDAVDETCPEMDAFRLPALALQTDAA